MMFSDRTMFTQQASPLAASVGGGREPMSMPMPSSMYSGGMSMGGGFNPYMMGGGFNPYMMGGGYGSPFMGGMPPTYMMGGGFPQMPQMPPQQPPPQQSMQGGFPPMMGGFGGFNPYMMGGGMMGGGFNPYMMGGGFNPYMMMGGGMMEGGMMGGFPPMMGGGFNPYMMGGGMMGGGFGFNPMLSPGGRPSMGGDNVDVFQPYTDPQGRQIAGGRPAPPMGGQVIPPMQPPTGGGRPAPAPNRYSNIMPSEPLQPPNQPVQPFAMPTGGRGQPSGLGISSLSLSPQQMQQLASVQNKIGLEQKIQGELNSAFNASMGRGLSLLDAAKEQDALEAKLRSQYGLEARTYRPG